MPLPPLMSALAAHPVRLVAATAVLAAVSLAPAARATLAQDLAVGTGYAADEICTRTLQSADDLWRVKWLYTAPDVSALPLIWNVQQQAGYGTTVSTIIPGAENKRLALYRWGLGCTIIPPGTSVDTVSAQPFRIHIDPPVNAQVWPQGEGTAETARVTPGQSAVLTRQSDALFAETALTINKRQNTFAVLVAKDGHLIYERYREGYTKDQPQHGWSMTKTLTALLTGMMASDGRLTLDGSPPVAQLAGGGKSAITWRQLLQMRSGLQWAETFGGYGPTAEMLWLQPDHGGYAASLPLASSPGQPFNYSTGNSSIVSLGLRNALGGGAQAAYDYYQERLFEPLGIRNGVIQPDANGTPSGGARGVLRPRDWLRIGQLILDRGQANGRTVVGADYIDFMTTPSPANAGYGASLWLYGELNMPSDTPRDIVIMWGVKGQYVMLIPSKRLAVLRMGVSFDEADTAQRMFNTMKELASVF